MRPRLVYLDGASRPREEALKLLRAFGMSEWAARSCLERCPPAAFSSHPDAYKRGPHKGEAGLRDDATGRIRPYGGAVPEAPAEPEGGAWGALRHGWVSLMLQLVNDDPGAATDRISSNAVYGVGIEGGRAAVFKPVAGERPGIRRFVSQPYHGREAAASEAAHLLGLGDLVPACVTRTLRGLEGSLQEYVPGAVPANALPESQRYGSPADLARAAAFDYLTGQSDRHFGNWLVGPGGRPVLIDNGMTFPEPGLEFSWHNFLREASRRGMEVPPEVSAWKKRWRQLEFILRRRGMSDGEVADTKRRLDALASATHFAHLPPMLAAPGPDLPRTTPFSPAGAGP